MASECEAGRQQQHLDMMSSRSCWRIFVGISLFLGLKAWCDCSSLPEFLCFDEDPSTGGGRLRGSRRRALTAQGGAYKVGSLAGSRLHHVSWAAFLLIFQEFHVIPGPNGLGRGRSGAAGGAEKRLAPSLSALGPFQEL